MSTFTILERPANSSAPWRVAGVVRVKTPHLAAAAAVRHVRNQLHLAGRFIEAKPRSLSAR